MKTYANRFEFEMVMSDDLYLHATYVLAPWIIGIISFIFVIVGAFMCYAIAAAVRLQYRLEKIASFVHEQQEAHEDHNIITLLSE